MEITLEILKKEIEDALRRGYSVGYADGYSKGRNPLDIEKSTFRFIIEHHLENIQETYGNKS
jgi:hypothetical protein